jgi:hypothetical protein
VVVLGVGVEGLLVLRSSELENPGPVELGGAVPLTIPWPPVELAVKIAPLKLLVNPPEGAVGSIVPFTVTDATPNEPSLSVTCSLSEEADSAP